MKNGTVNLVSISGGKDSTAMLLLALEGDEEVQAVFADTGNEHPMTYDYVRQLEHQLGINVHWIKEDFSQKWWARRDYIRDKWPEKGVDPHTIERALSIFNEGPTGNPYLDLCMIKGRFPSRMAQFCTQYLKRQPLEQYSLQLLDAYKAVVSWQGVRADESPNRAKLPQRDVEFGQWEPVPSGLLIYRPILYWNVEQVFAQHRKHGIEPNPLYKLGMGRVGCMPCINASKAELAEINRRFPEHIERIALWELLVAGAAKRSDSSFFSAGEKVVDIRGDDVWQYVKWAQTKRGGKEANPIYNEPAPMCQSAYGLCE